MEEEEEEEVSSVALVDEVVCEEGAPEWVVTFGDMMSLLLTFFILLLSFAQMEAQKYKIFSGSVMRAFGVQQVVPTFTRPQGRKVIPEQFSMKFSSQNMLQGMKAAKQRHTNRSPAGKVEIEIFEDYRGIVVSIGGEGMFEAGKDDIRPAVYAFLDDLLEVADRNEAQIQVEAHTDGSPIHTARFPTNDDLAAGRSVAVIHYFLGRGRGLLGHGLVPSRVEAVPWGDNRPKSVNMSEAGRKKNRRVELVFYAVPRDLRPKY